MPSVSGYVCQHVCACAHTKDCIYPPIEDLSFKRKNDVIPCPDKMLRQGLHKFFKSLEATSKF
jgi:hypothetical protein